MTYRAVGFRIRRGVFWMAVALATLMLNVTLAQYAFRSDPALLRVVTQVVWILGVFLGTCRILKGLEQLEENRAEPTESMKLAFDGAVILPIAGYLPMLVFGS